MNSGDDWRFWQWALGLVGSILSGAAVGGWVARGALEAIKQRVSTVEREQTKCQNTIKDEIRAIVQQTVDNNAARYNEHLQAIRTELAVLVALHGETQKDVQSIFERMDRRRQEYASPTPHGERRDQ